jgi:TfoX/Sxy family transcriptional regulator of competence genes
MAHPYLEQLQGLVRIIDRRDVELVCKHFFSGAALYVNGKMCASLSPAGLAFKLGKQRSEELIASQVAVPLCYFKGAPIKRDYVLFPESLELKSGTFYAYCNESIEYSCK